MKQRYAEPSVIAVDCAKEMLESVLTLPIDQRAALSANKMSNQSWGQALEACGNKNIKRSLRSYTHARLRRDIRYNRSPAVRK